MDELKELIKELEYRTLEIEVNQDKTILFEIYDLFHKNKISSKISSRIKKYLDQFDILVGEIRRGDIPLNKNSMFILKLILNIIQREEDDEEENFSQEERYSLIEEFLEETEELFKSLKKAPENAPSLLHRLKGSIGIFASVCKDKDRELAKDFLLLVEKLEKEAKKRRLKLNEIKDIENFFIKIKEEYERERRI